MWQEHSSKPTHSGSTQERACCAAAQQNALPQCSAGTLPRPGAETNEVTMRSTTGLHSIDNGNARQRGSTIVYLIVALVIFGSLAAASVALFSSSRMTTARPNCQAQARFMAESGLRYAASELRQLTGLLNVNQRIAALTGSQRTNTLSDGNSFTFTTISSPYQVGGTGAYYVNVTCQGTACSGSSQAQTSLTATYSLSVTDPGQLGFEDDFESFEEIGEGTQPFFPDQGRADDAVQVDPETKTIILGGGERGVFGCIWYGGDLQTCTDGDCLLGSGFRAYFDFELAPGSRGDGFTFTVMSASENPATACGGQSSPYGFPGELLGYAGPGISGQGILPPKLALEFDLFRNSGQDWPCQLFSRNDVRHDHVAVVYWGREDDYGPSCDGCFDDNQHGAGLLTDEEPRNPSDWSNSGAGFDGYYYENSNSWIRNYNNNWPDQHKKFRVRVELDRSLEANAEGFYCYALKGWIVRDDETMPDGFDDLTQDYADPDNPATLPQITNSVVLNQNRHDQMEHVRFGWTTATGATTMLLTLSDFALNFKVDPEYCATKQAPTDYLAYWPMYEGSGDVLHDISDNDLDGSISNAYWVAGTGCPSCSGLLVDNRNQGQAHILKTTPNSQLLDLTNRGAVSAWVYLNSYQNWGGIVHHGDSRVTVTSDGILADETYTLQFTQNNIRFDGERIRRGERKPMFCTFQDDAWGTPYGNCLFADDEMELQRWYHIVATWDTAAPGDDMRLYINGQLSDTRGTCDGSRSRNVGLHIGSQIINGGYPIDGVIDGVYIYDRMLSEEEVQGLYHDGLEHP